MKKNNVRNTGFTLIEVLLAIFIFSILITTLFSSFHSVLANADGVAENMSTHEMAKSCFNRMTLDLRSLYITPSLSYQKPDFDDPPDSYRLTGDIPDQSGGDFARIRFTSLAHLPLGGDNREGIAQIVFYVDTTDEENPVLRRFDSLDLAESFEENSNDPVLCERVKTFEIKYYDEENEENETWNSDSDEFAYATPRAVEIKLEIGDESSFNTFATMIRMPIYRDKLD